MSNFGCSSLVLVFWLRASQAVLEEAFCFLSSVILAICQFPVSYWKIRFSSIVLEFPDFSFFPVPQFLPAFPNSFQVFLIFPCYFSIFPGLSIFTPLLSISFPVYPNFFSFLGYSSIPVISHHVILRRVILRHVISHRVISCRISHGVVLRRILCHVILRCMSFHFTSCRFVSFCIISCCISRHIILCCSISCHAILHHIISPRYFTSCHSCRVISQCVISHAIFTPVIYSSFLTSL